MNSVPPINGKRQQINERAIQDELVCLQQAVRVLLLAEQLARSGELDSAPGELVAVIKSGRQLVEEAAGVFSAHFAAKDGAS